MYVYLLLKDNRRHLFVNSSDAEYKLNYSEV